MKIVHVTQYFNPNYGYQENILPLYQQQLGHEVVLLTSTRGSSFLKTRVFPAGQTLENGLRVIRLDIAWEFQDKFVCFRNLMAALESEKPDYIFHHMPTTLSIRTVAAYKRRHPATFLAVDNHADLSISIDNRMLFTLYYSIFWRTFLKYYNPWIDLYFGVTPARCLFLSEHLGVPAEKVRLLPIGADVQDTLTVAQNQEIVSRLGLESGLIYLIHGGKMTRDKQVDRLLTAFSHVKQSNLRLLLFGSIEDSRLDALIKADARIQHLGWLNREETLTVLRHSSLGIWNTRHTTLLEDAVAMGLPLILRYYGSTCHLIDHSGLFLYEGSAKEIQERIETVVSQPDLLMKFRQEAARLRDELSYLQIARESIAYRDNLTPQPIHQKFMSQEYCKTNYPQFRKLSLKKQHEE